MTDVKRLLEQATPLPWRISPGPEVDPTDWVIFGGPPGADAIWVTNLEEPLTGWATNSTAFPPARVAMQGMEANAELIVYAVNRLPDYEAAVDALHAIYSGEIGFKNPHHPDIAKAREVLRRLREQVPA